MEAPQADLALLVLWALRLQLGWAWVLHGGNTEHLRDESCTMRLRKDNMQWLIQSKMLEA